MVSAIVERIRDTIKKNPRATGIVIVIMIVTALLYATCSLGNFGRNVGLGVAATKAFFMDEETGAIEIHPALKFPAQGQVRQLHRRPRAFFHDQHRRRQETHLPRTLYARRQAGQGSDPRRPAADHGGNGGPSQRHPGAYLRKELAMGFHRHPEGHAVLNGVSALNPDVNKVRPVFPR